MNSEVTAIDMAGNFFVNHGPPPFMGVPDSTEGAWIVGFSRLARRFYAQYDLQEFPFDVQVICRGVCCRLSRHPATIGLRSRLTMCFQSAEILFESFAYNQDKLLWKPSAILVNTILPKGFTVDGCKPRATSLVAPQHSLSLSQGQLSPNLPYPFRMSANPPPRFCLVIFSHVVACTYLSARHTPVQATSPPPPPPLLPSACN